LALGLTQRDVADCLSSFGISRDGLARIELGEVWPNPGQIVALAHFYEVEVGTLATEVITGWLKRRDQSKLLLLASARRSFHQPSLPLGSAS
jgi:transcriptional regulator with XRE-family HTH domain